MDDILIMLAQAGTSLTSLAVKNAAGSVYSRVKVLKDEKDLSRVKETYNEIISELLVERDEAIKAGLSYKNEYEKLTISDDDISYLQTTISNMVDLLNSMNTTSPNMNDEMIKSIKSLISMETMKSMQLLGFNYKKAIGEPLTDACSSLISRKLSNNSKTKQGNINKNR